MIKFIMWVTTMKTMTSITILTIFHKYLDFLHKDKCMKEKMRMCHKLLLVKTTKTVSKTAHLTTQSILLHTFLKQNLSLCSY